MTRRLFENSRVWQEDKFVSGHSLVIADGRVEALLPSSAIKPRPGDMRHDAGGAYILPGFVDIHVHGGDGHDVMDGRDAAMQGLSAFFARQGVTSYLATTMADTRSRIDAAFAAISSQGRGNCIGIHLEGPYLNRQFRGSQPEAHLRSPQPEEYLPWLDSGLIKLITLAPELDGASELMAAALERGITLAIGHSAAGYDAMRGYIKGGISQVTHTFNGMAGIHHRQPGIFVAASEHQQVSFQIIPDGVHVHPAVVRMLLRLAGRERVLVISDAMRAAGLGDGSYGMGDVPVIVKDGIARDQHGSLAGSTLTMADALRNMMAFCGLSLAEALPMLTRSPAKSIGIYPRKGSLQVGADADLVIWDEHSGVQATVIGGEPAYLADDACIAATAGV